MIEQEFMIINIQLIFSQVNSTKYINYVDGSELLQAEQFCFELVDVRAEVTFMVWHFGQQILREGVVLGEGDTTAV